MTASANWDGHQYDPAGEFELPEQDRREIAMEVAYDRYLDAAGLD